MLNPLDFGGAGYLAGPFLRAPESEHLTSILVPGTTANCDDVMIQRNFLLSNLQFSAVILTTMILSY